MSDASYPEGLYYNEDHDWARVDGESATFGITWYAQDALGEVVFYSPAAVGTVVSKGGEYGELESTKLVSDLYSPVNGEVSAINEKLLDDPTRVATDPYGKGWMVKIKIDPGSTLDHLMTLEQYEKQIATEEH